MRSLTLSFFLSLFSFQEQYEFCYKVVQEYIDAFSDYANFQVALGRRTVTRNRTTTHKRTVKSMNSPLQTHPRSRTVWLTWWTRWGPSPHVVVLKGTARRKRELQSRHRRRKPSAFSHEKTRQTEMPSWIFCNICLVNTALFVPLASRLPLESVYIPIPRLLSFCFLDHFEVGYVLGWHL